MLGRILLFLNALVVLLLVLIAAGALYFAGTSPIAFQKVMSLRPGAVADQDWTAGEALDVERFISAIPYRSAEAVPEVYPERLYEKTVLEGRGNCANKSRGLTYYLNRRGIPFERVDLLPFDGFLDGKGHTLVRTRYSLRGTDKVGVVDMLEGGVLSMRDQLLDLEDLRYAAPYTIEVVPLNARMDSHSDYYGSFIETAAVAVTPTEHTKRFFRFIEAVYVPFGDARLERLVYNATAVVLGVFPLTYVSPENYHKLLVGNGGVLAMATALTWAVRILVVAIALEAVLRLGRRGVRLVRGRGATA